ncbi:glycosyltransferase family 2 protein [Rhodococcus erythropolis]|uniref:glycosyltransferase family 2 protein n=1 Tax=Rhodococcus erythropolis TaxID=1833 RepID=UPI001CD99D7B|nr:glycosyltransferase family A protein [Rhodococcus erythropolis]
MQEIEHLSTNRLSVVVPVFNEENSLSNCIERLLIQSEIDEILVVDNNSTDSTASIIHKFAEKHDRVRYVFEARQGVVHARNAGFDASTGNIIGRIDADTRVQPGWGPCGQRFLPAQHCAFSGRRTHLSLRIAVCSNPPFRTGPSGQAGKVRLRTSSTCCRRSKHGDQKKRMAGRPRASQRPAGHPRRYRPFTVPSEGRDDDRSDRRHASRNVRSTR